MKKLIPLIFSVLFIAFYSCQESGTFDEIEAVRLDEESFKPDKNQREPDYGDLVYSSYESKEVPGCTSETYELTAGQTIDVGSLIVSNDEENLYVTFVQDESYTRGKIRETHVFVGCGPDEIPLNGGGNPVIGHFPYSDDHGEVMQYTYEIPLDQFDCGTDCLTIVAHAAIGGETAFGGCDDDEADKWEGRRWGCYFDYCPGECEETELAWFYKSSSRATCYEFTDDPFEVGISNRVNFSTAYKEGAPYPVYNNVEYDDVNESCDISESELVGYITIYVLDRYDLENARVKLVFNAESGYDPSMWIGYVGWQNPIVNGEFDSGLNYKLFGVSVIGGTAEIELYSKYFVGSPTEINGIQQFYLMSYFGDFTP